MTLDNLREENERLRQALLPFARAGYEQTSRFAAWNGACYLPPEEKACLTVDDIAIDVALEALGVVKQIEGGVEIDVTTLDDEDELL